MKLFFLFFLLTIFTDFAQAKLLIISDVDDTIKVSYALNTLEAAAYSSDTSSRFLGMSELFRIIKLENKDADFIYLSNAPVFLMKETHELFLNQNLFPKGIYIGRTELTVPNHKVDRLREILGKHKSYYSHVIFIGDNGQQDPAVYDQISKEFQLNSTNSTTLIHKVYSSKNPQEVGTKIEKNQIGFVTAAEAALELNSKKIIGDYNTSELIRVMGPVVDTEPMGKAYDEMTFSYYMTCDHFEWPWKKDFPNLNLIKNKVREFCE